MKKLWPKIVSACLTIFILSACLCVTAGAAVTPRSQAYEKLAEVIADAEQNVMTKPEGYWDANSYDYFLEKYEYAKGVLMNPASTDEDYRTAKQALEEGRSQLVHIFSQAFLALANEVGYAERIIYTPGGPEWTDESRAFLISEYEYAKGVRDDLDSTNQDYIEAKERLSYAIKHLETYNDKTALCDVLYQVEGSGRLEDTGRYTQTSYQKFEQAYNKAKGLEHAYKIPQEEIDEAVDALNHAIDGLVLMGDVNNDKEINIQDVLKVQKALAHSLELSADALEAADTDRNGTVGVNDCLMIQKYAAKIIEGFSA